MRVKRKAYTKRKWRQGDVLFVRVRSLPKAEATKRDNGHIVEGEVTGHVHRVGTLEAAEVLEIGDGLFLNVTAEGGVSIVHEDHNPLSLPSGVYEVHRQREYSPQGIRSVAD